MATITQRRARDVLAEYERALAGAPLAAQSRRAYRSRVAGYLRWLTMVTLAGDPLSEPPARDRAVSRYRAWLTTVHAARPTTVNAALTALDHFYRQLRLGPATTGREEIPASVRRALPPEAQHRLLRAADEQPSTRDRAIAYTLLFTGVRVAELVALDVTDLHPAARPSRLVVRDGAGREIPLHRTPQPVLASWLADRRRWAGARQDPALFLNRRGGRLSTRSVDDLVARLGEWAGVPGEAGGRLTPRVLRHTFGASLVRAGTDLPLVAALMGHKRLDSTRHYLAVAGGTGPEGDAGARRALARAYG